MWEHVTYFFKSKRFQYIIFVKYQFMLTKTGKPCRTFPANLPQSNLIMVHSAYQPIIGDNINFNINYTNSVTQNNIWAYGEDIRVLYSELRVLRSIRESTRKYCQLESMHKSNFQFTNTPHSPLSESRTIFGIIGCTYVNFGGVFVNSLSVCISLGEILVSWSVNS